MEPASPTKPAPPRASPADEVSRDVWGFADTRFALLPNASVTLTGNRYALSGAELPDLLPWVEEVMQVRLELQQLRTPQYPPPVREPVVNRAFLDELRQVLGRDATADDPLLRLRHGHGHTVGAMYAIKYGRIERVPDCVVFPESEAEVTAIVRAAGAHRVCLVPYGGGTNVTDALSCDPAEERMIVAVDLAKMNKILWVDAENRMACIEAGAVGRDIATALSAHGFTMGHEPDSVELSTLGGWIATNASGMKKNRYGNIEEIVLDMRVVTVDGVVAGNDGELRDVRDLGGRAATAPRVSIGMDPRRWMFGSEGSLGIVTQAVVKLFPLPEVKEYDSVIFPDFEAGFRFLRDLTAEGPVPASARLVDNLQFQFSQKLKPRPTGAAALKRRAERWYVTRLRGFDPLRMVACTLVHEGTADQVRAERATVKRLARRHGGLRAGAENGKKGYELTFSIAYIRDFIMGLEILGESFETSVPWSRALALCENVKRRVREECAARGLPGQPFITARITQLYQTGVAVYFYLGFHHRGVERPDLVFAEVEHAARDEILKSGGSLSHHHGVGKIRRDFLPRVFSPAALSWNAAVKGAVDPQNVFGVGGP